MRTSFGHLTYCTNIHSGETWPEHFAQVQQFVPAVKKQIAPDKPFGIGLRLSHAASLELQREEILTAFKQWLAEQNCYVFTINGFPYGGFHHTKVKDQVHAPDWTTSERVEYTVRLAEILSRLLPDGMEGGVSTSPLSYKYWHQPQQVQKVLETATRNVLEVTEQLIRLRTSTGKLIHLDIEPEPVGLLESGSEFLEWYQHHLLPAGNSFLQKSLGYTEKEAGHVLKEHVQLCYDVCHFAIGFEDHESMVKQLEAAGIKTGKIQISAALKAFLPTEGNNRDSIRTAFEPFNESTYLHQVIGRQSDGSLKRYSDLPEALQDVHNPSVKEWRAHFHVPLFVSSYGIVQSTQEDIEKVLSIHRQQPFTQHLEIETYTWDVLPEALKRPLKDSIVRELKWVEEALS